MAGGASGGGSVRAGPPLRTNHSPDRGGRESPAEGGPAPPAPRALIVRYAGRPPSPLRFGIVASALHFDERCWKQERKQKR